ncbi:MAG: diaminopimelate epimerase [Deltaproteobacteria bacterium]|nr:diaminopimelate epimerase [Deltaproteobacteria bacterium]
MPIPFVKLEGAGNGYIVIDARDLERNWSSLAPRLCDPHFGVGSNGLALVERSDLAPVRMRIINSDGSESEMSGNGIRLFAKFVLDAGIAEAGQDGLPIETAGGIRVVYPRFGSSGMQSARVAMGRPVFRPHDIPVDVAALGGADRLVDHPLTVAGRTLRVTCLAIGNPHAVALLDEPVEDFPLADVGPAVTEHPLFPNRINFEIVHVESRSRIRVRIFERGEGETLASGTGSTASVIAARLHDRVEDDVEVVLPGGALRVRWDGEGEAELEGPAVEVFRGVWPDSD